MSESQKQELHGRLKLDLQNHEYIVFSCRLPGCGFKVAVPLTDDGEVIIINEGNPRGARHYAWTSDELKPRGIEVEDEDPFRDFFRGDEYNKYWGEVDE